MLKACCCSADITSQYPFIKTASSDVFVFPEAKILCLVLEDLALVLSWDDCTDSFLDKGGHPKFTKINIPMHRGGSNG